MNISTVGVTFLLRIIEFKMAVSNVRLCLEEVACCFLQPHSDIIYGWMEDDGKARMTDAYTDVYAAPVRDLRQDAKNIAGKVVDRFTTLTLTRKRLTKDDKDFQFTDNKCPYFIFPVRGGVYDPNSMMIMKHKATPLVSTQRICITSACAATAGNPTGDSFFGVERLLLMVSRTRVYGHAQLMRKLACALHVVFGQE